MSKRRRSLLRVTEPRVVVGPSGVRLRPPRLRLGGKGIGVYLGRHGLSVTLRPGAGARRQNRGCLSLLPCGVLTLLGLLVTLVWPYSRRRARLMAGNSFTAARRYQRDKEMGG